MRDPPLLHTTQTKTKLKTYRRRRKLLKYLRRKGPLLITLTVYKGRGGGNFQIFKKVVTSID